eukprot:7378226-Prymnesium_polylepis.2
MPPLAEQMPPPPPRPPTSAAASGGSSDAAVPAPSAADSSRERGERGGARHKKRPREEGMAANAAQVGAAPFLQTLASMAQAHASATQGLGADERRWGNKMLACTAQCYSLVQSTVAEGGHDALLGTMEQVQHKVSSLLGDICGGQRTQPRLPPVRQRLNTLVRTTVLAPNAAEAKAPARGAAGARAALGALLRAANAKGLAAWVAVYCVRGAPVRPPPAGDWTGLNRSPQAGPACWIGV